MECKIPLSGLVIFLLSLTVCTCTSPENKEIVCDDNEPKILKCSGGEIIRVIKTIYGRNNKEICTVRKAPRKCRVVWDFTYGIAARCNGKPTCRLVLSHRNVIGDPCPGDSKYFEIFYNCETGKRMLECKQNIKRELTCNEREVIKVVKATLGNYDSKLCEGRFAPAANCKFSHDITNYVTARCNGKIKCELQLTSTVLGDPCPWGMAYYLIFYNCKPVYWRIFCESTATIASALTCNDGSVIKVTKSTYGRRKGLNYGGCGKVSGNCQFVFDTQHYVGPRCNYKQSCDVRFTHLDFGDPCHGATKWSEVSWDCVPAKHEIICEHEGTRHLKCDGGDVVKVDISYIGNTNDHTICNAPVRGPPCACRTPITEHAGYSCNGQQSCGMHFSVDSLGDSWQGYSKYFEIFYHCDPEFNEKICGNSTKNKLSCATGKVLKIKTSTWGRPRLYHHDNICPDVPSKMECKYNWDVYHQVARSCNGKQRCLFRSDKVKYGDPCPGQSKYFDISYNCVSEFESIKDVEFPGTYYEASERRHCLKNTFHVYRKPPEDCPFASVGILVTNDIGKWYICCYPKDFGTFTSHDLKVPQAKAKENCENSHRCTLPMAKNPAMWRQLLAAGNEASTSQRVYWVGLERVTKHPGNKFKFLDGIDEDNVPMYTDRFLGGKDRQPRTKCVAFKKMVMGTARLGYSCLSCSSSYSYICQAGDEQGWVTDPKTGKQYIFIQSPGLNRYGHVRLCEELGGYLPEPRDDDDNDFLVTLAAEIRIFYLGITNIEDEKEWVYDSDGSMMTWAKWIYRSDRIEPAGGKGVNCVVMARSQFPPPGIKETTTSWANIPCQGSRFNFDMICEKKPNWVVKRSLSTKYIALQTPPRDHDYNQAVCAKIGGYLPEPRIEEEFDVITTEVLKMYYKRDRNGHYVAEPPSFMLGMREKPGGWTWESDGSAVEWFYWNNFTDTHGKQESEPNGGKLEDCAAMAGHWENPRPGHDPHGWADVRCDNSDNASMIIVCEAEREWEIDRKTGKQYLVLDMGANHSLSHETLQGRCHSFGGYLPEPRTLHDNDFLDSLNPKPFQLGMTDEQSECTWMWDSDGSRVHWTFWAGSNTNREPNGGTEQNCAVMIRNKWQGAQGFTPKRWASDSCESFLNIAESLVCEKE